MKRDWLLRRVSQITTTVLVAVVLLACATVVNAAEEKQDDRWRFMIAPYLWLPTISGTTRLNLPSGGSGLVDYHVGPGDYLDNLRFTGMLDMQMQKGRWSIQADVIYLNFEDNDRTAHFQGVLPGSPGFAAGVDTKFQAWFFQVVGGYTVFRNECLNFDLLAGLRYAGIDAKADLTIVGPLPGLEGVRDLSRTEYFVDPIVGFKGKFELGKKWFVPYYFDIGGFSVDSDLTLQAYAAIGYRFCDWFSMELGYRYLYYDFGDSKDMNIYGTMLGFRFTF